MKSFQKKYKHLIALCGISVFASSLVALGAPVITGFAIVALWQLMQFAMSKRSGVCYTAALTPEQITEFTKICGELKELGSHIPGIKELSAIDGGFATIKALPGLFKTEQKRVDDLHGQISKLVKSNLNRKSNGLRGDQVSDECARHLGILAAGIGVRSGSIKGAPVSMVESMFKEIIGAEIKTALTSSDIPLPTEYSGQVVELVGLFGTARKYGTVFPLGAGTVKLPKLGTDTTFTLNVASASITEKSPTVPNVTFTAEKFGGLVRFPTELEEDSIVPLGQFLARYGARQVARVEDHNFWAGTGAASGVNGTAEGFTKNVVTNSKTLALASGDLSINDATLAKLRTLRTIPDAAALRNGAYYFHPSMEQKLNSFNTSGDRPYNPNASMANNGAQPFTSGPTLDGFPVRWIDVLPVYSTADAASTVFGLFGDPSFQYLGVRGGVRFDTSMEAGFTTDEILIRILERFTIGLMANGSMSGIITAAA